MPRSTVPSLLIGLVCFGAAPLMANELSAAAMPGQIYSHGTIRQTAQMLEAVVDVAVELMPNIHAGQQVWMDVRQGQLRGIVKAVHSPVEVTIALDASRSRVKMARLQPGQSVIAVIQIEAECGCETPELR